MGEEIMLNIAIDGFSGAGKSTIAGELAKRLNIKKFDTGAIYRGIACEYLKQGLPLPTTQLVDKFVEDLNVSVFFEGDVQHIVVNGEDYTKHLREEQISKFSAVISPFPKVRAKVLELQREFAKNNDCVMEGRDIGSVVLPNASVKFFFTASVEVRAKRRLAQLEEMGLQGDFQDICENLKERDYRDLTREIAPLKKVEDAFEIDGSDISIDEVVKKCINIICKKTGQTLN